MSIGLSGQNPLVDSGSDRRGATTRRSGRGDAEADKTGERVFGVAMGEMARALHRHHNSVEEMLEAVITAAVANIPGAVSAGISLQARRGRLETRSATDAVPARVADVQSELGQGPCLEAIQQRGPVRIDDLAAEQRWPRFTARMAAEPVTSMLSVPLMASDDSLGSLSVFGADTGVFDRDSEEMGLVLASHAAIAIAGAQHEEGMRLALDNRDLIGQAKGILMERHKVTADQAFLMLVRTSQRLNVKLRDVAARITATGEFDPD
jgi:GAF domain-containing protein